MSNIPQHFFEKGEKNSTSYFGSCFSLNWEKVLFLSDLAFLISEIALGFFINLPPLFIFSLGAWGFLNIILRSINNNHSSSSENQELKQKIQQLREENDLLRQNWNRKMTPEEMQEKLAEEIKQQQSKLEGLLSDIKKTEEKLKKE